GDIQVFPAAASDICSARPDAPARMSDAGALGDILELSISQIAVERTSSGLRVFGGLDRERVDKIEINQTIVVEIERRDAAAHRLDDVFFFGRCVVLKSDAGLGGDITEEQLRRIGRM